MRVTADQLNLPLYGARYEHRAPVRGLGDVVRSVLGINVVSEIDVAAKGTGGRARRASTSSACDQRPYRRHVSCRDTIGRWRQEAGTIRYSKSHKAMTASERYPNTSVVWRLAQQTMAQLRKLIRDAAPELGESEVEHARGRTRATPGRRRVQDHGINFFKARRSPIHSICSTPDSMPRKPRHRHPRGRPLNEAAFKALVGAAMALNGGGPVRRSTTPKRRRCVARQSPSKEVRCFPCRTRPRHDHRAHHTGGRPRFHRTGHFSDACTR